MSILRGKAFVEGEDLQPDRNIKKMATGQSIDDDDRVPRYARASLALTNVDWPAVIEFSTLKNSCHDWTRRKVEVPVRIRRLGLPEVEFANRVITCTGHFKPHALRNSHFGALERLSRPEPRGEIDIAKLFAAAIARLEHIFREKLV